jgi:predicted outer membrane repeat protein
VNGSEKRQSHSDGFAKEAAIACNLFIPQNISILNFFREGHMKKRAITRGFISSVLMIVSLAAGMAFLPLQPAFATGVTRYAATTGFNTGDCTSRLNPCQTIAYAISQANNGDTIRISAGTYIANLVPDKDLNFYGAGMNTTILDGSGTGRVISNNSSYNLVIKDMTIQNGHTSGSGGGIAHWGVDGTLALTRVKVTGNVANLGGGIYSSAVLNMNDSVVSANNANIDATASYGGGLYLNGSGASLNLVNVTISGNTATGLGGGLYTQREGSVNLTNVTISGNTAKIDGAMSNHGTGGALLTILNSTITDNHHYDLGSNGGIGIYETVDVNNTIISGNKDTNCSIGSGGVVVSLGHNLDSRSDCNFTQTGDLHNTDPVLGILADNGGPTQTHALLDAALPLHPRSPAIDAGAAANCPAADQRGMLRPQGALCDIGAYEYSSCANKPAHINGTGDYYDFIGQAYAAVSDGQIILIQAYQFSEDLSLGNARTFTLKGGYDCNFAASGSFSAVSGSLTISSGTVTIENLKIK